MSLTGFSPRQQRKKRNENELASTAAVAALVPSVIFELRAQANEEMLRVSA